MDRRYLTPEMDRIWNERTRNHIERELWIGVMRQQREAGVPIPEEHIEDYCRVTTDLYHPVGGSEYAEMLEIADIEREVKHDLYARMLYFNRLAGHEWIHLGLTSADIVENAQQVQVIRSIEALLDHAEQVLLRLNHWADRQADRPMAARTHGRPAQITTVGKRFVDWAVELTHAVGALDAAHSLYMPRGIKGAVGTRADMAALLARYHSDTGEPSQAHLLAHELDETVVRGFAPDDDIALTSCGQVYPRSMDLGWVGGALQLAAACDTIATGIRLWAVLGHGNERKQGGQVGSSAMPHKANPRFSERVHSLNIVARGYGSMLQQLAGGQWFEGDVSTSAGRRIALPGLLCTVDAVLANTAHALDRLELSLPGIGGDMMAHLPQLATGVILEAFVGAGMGRDAAHRLIGSYAGVSDREQFARQLGNDELSPLGPEQIGPLMSRAALAAPAWYVVRGWLDRMAEAELPERDEAWPGELL